MSDGTCNFKGRVAIVTGSGRGLGREHALLLGHLGAAVVVNSTTTATAESTTQEIIQAGGKAIAHVGSIIDRNVADALVKAAVDTFGRIDIIINNAGYTDPSLFENTTDDQLWEQLRLHVGGSWNTTQAAWPYMKKQKYGRVVLITSLMMFGAATQSTYAASKLALVGLAKSIALEGKEHNILVNTIGTSGYSPGAAKALQSDQIHELMKKHMPAADAAPAVLWLAHEDFKRTGESYAVAGRLVTRVFLAETEGFVGSSDEEWTLETMRDHWEQVEDEENFTVHNDAAVFGPQLFQRLSTGESQLLGSHLHEALSKK